MPDVRTRLRDADRILQPLARACLLLSCLLLAAVATSAQQLDVKITVVSSSPPRARVEGRRAEGATAWSFRNFYAGASGLAERVENFALADESGAQVELKKLAPGEFAASKGATRFSYDLKLDPPAFVNDAPHVSWLAAERGLLLPADILPLPLKGARVELVLPAGWNVSTVETPGAGGVFDLADAERAVFVVGRDLRERRARLGRMGFGLTTAGAWAFDDRDAEESSAEILKIYERMMGGVPAAQSMLVILPQPTPAAATLWSAETRGSTVVLVTGSLPSKNSALAQLNGSLSHELLHLWLPNALALDGEYDWFYEGFTNYKALRVGMERGQLTFQDYLSALGRAFDAYKSARRPKEVSLVEASQKRWSGSAAFVYHKATVVAFLYDLELMRRTGGKDSLNDVYRELFRLYGPGAKRAEGNRAVAELLGATGNLRDFVERFVKGASEIDLAAAVGAYGLKVEQGGVRTRLAVADSLERPQQELLGKLGYNERTEREARKLRERMKRQSRR